MQQLSELNLFIQKNEKYYAKKFKKMNETGKNISWNWAAFFMGIYWMIYRKMYFKAAAFLLLSIVAATTPYIGEVLNIAILFGIGIYANALYLDHVEVNIKRAKQYYPHNINEVLIKKGGTNLPLTISLYGLNVVIAALLLIF